MIPHLIHPVPVTFALLIRGSLILDVDAREVVHGVREDAEIAATIYGQPKWVYSQSVAAQEAGDRVTADGYVLCRMIDVLTLPAQPKISDRITQIGSTASAGSGLYIIKVEPCANYSDSGGATLVKYYFNDREPTTRRVPV